MFSALTLQDDYYLRMVDIFEENDSVDHTAARLERIREAFGLSKKEFAERLGISEQSYGSFENGRRELTLIAAKKIRKTYSIPLEFIYFGKIDDLPTRVSRAL